MAYAKSNIVVTKNGYTETWGNVPDIIERFSLSKTAQQIRNDFKAHHGVCVCNGYIIQKTEYKPENELKLTSFKVIYTSMTLQKCFLVTTDNKEQIEKQFIDSGYWALAPSFEGSSNLEELHFVER